MTRNEKNFTDTAGRQILTLIEKDIKPLDIINTKSLDNALILDMAMGGSTNTVLHSLAIASEAGIAYDLERINELSARCPNICRVSPSSKYHVEDVDAAGGVSAILKEVSKIKGLAQSRLPDRNRQNSRQKYRQGKNSKIPK